MTGVDELSLLNRIYDELKGMREDFRCLAAKHDDVAADVIRLKEDRVARDRLASTRTTYVCAFGAVVVSAVLWLVNLAYDNKARIDSINSFGTAYGRGKEEVFNSRFERIERRLPKEANP